MIRVGIIGATGYAGGELVRILLNHKDAKIVWYGSRSYIDKKYYQVYQNMFQLVEDICKDDNLEELAKQVDVIFTATPQGFLAGLLTEEILSQVKSRLHMYLTSSGHSAAAIRAMSKFSKSAKMNDRMSGVAFFQTIDALEKNFDEQKEVLKKNLRAVM